MRELLVGGEAFGQPGSRILDFRFETKRGWLGSQVICVIVTAEREFRGTGRTADVAVQDAIEAWEKHFLLSEETDPVTGAPPTPSARFAAGRDALETAATADSSEIDDSGYMSSQMFSTRRPARVA